MLLGTLDILEIYGLQYTKYIKGKYWSLRVYDGKLVQYLAETNAVIVRLQIQFPN